MSAPVTQWFDGSTKPVRCGLYQRLVIRPNDFDFWDGMRWLYNETDTASQYQNVEWRGLASQPDTEKK